MSSPRSRRFYEVERPSNNATGIDPDAGNGSEGVQTRSGYRAKEMPVEESLFLGEFVTPRSEQPHVINVT